VESGSALIWSTTNDTAKVIINKENNYVKDVTLLEDEGGCKKGIAISTIGGDGEWEKCKKFADAKTCSLYKNEGSKSGKSASHKGGKSGKSASHKGGKSGKSASHKGGKSDDDKKSRMLRKRLLTRV
jgi:hypothetical protein